MTKLQFICGVLGVLFLLISPVHVFGLHNVIDDGRFENPKVNSWQFFQPGSSIGAWTVLEDGVYLHDNWQDADSGSGQSVELRGPAGGGGIEQWLETIPGESYIIRFAMAGFPAYPHDKAMDLFWDDTLVERYTFNTTGKSALNMGWEFHEVELTAWADQTLISFKSVGYTKFGGPALDSVKVLSEVPEPMTLLLLCGGGGAVLRRRRGRR